MTDLFESKFRSRRLMLGAGYSEESVRDLASAAGWNQIVERPADIQRNIARCVIWNVIPGLTVSYYYENPAEASCLIIRSARDEAEIREIERLLMQVIDFVNDEDLLASPAARTGSSLRERILGLLRLGLGAPVNIDQRYFDRLATATNDSDPDIRIAAVRGIIYTEWPQFKPLLGYLVDHDPKRSIRKLARQALLVFDKLGLEDSGP